MLVFAESTWKCILRLEFQTTHRESRSEFHRLKARLGAVTVTDGIGQSQLKPRQALLSGGVPLIHSYLMLDQEYLLLTSRDTPLESCQSGHVYTQYRLPRWPLVVKNPPASAGDARDPGSIPGSGRSPGGGHSNPLQGSCVENPMASRAWWATVHGVTQRGTPPSDLAQHRHPVQLRDLREPSTEKQMSIIIRKMCPREGKSFLVAETRDAGEGGRKVRCPPGGCLHHGFSCVESKLFLKVKLLCARLAFAPLCMAHHVLTACVCSAAHFAEFAVPHLLLTPG